MCTVSRGPRIGLRPACWGAANRALRSNRGGLGRGAQGTEPCCQLGDVSRKPGDHRRLSARKAFPGLLAITHSELEKLHYDRDVTS